MVYQWKSTAMYKVDAQRAGAELERITRDRLALTPEIIVDESREESAALHNCFEWNDEAAAESWRKQQARQIVDSLVTVEVDGQTTPEPVRAFVHIHGNYTPIDIVVKTKEHAAEMLAQAQRDFSCYRRKYSVLTELAQMFKVADEVFNQGT
jgi:hypothetical protein